MKNLEFFFVGFLALILLLSCQNGSNDSVGISKKSEKALNYVDSTITPAPPKPKVIDSVPVQEVPKIVKLYWFMGGQNPETGENIEAQRLKFKEGENSYCYDTMEFTKMEVTGNESGIVLAAYDDQGGVFKSEKFNAKDKKTFKKFGSLYIGEGGGINRIEIKKDDNVIFKAKIIYQGCS